jgi:hypothetical protein
METAHSLSSFLYGRKKQLALNFSGAAAGSLLVGSAALGAAAGAKAAYAARRPSYNYNNYRYNRHGK